MFLGEVACMGKNDDVIDIFRFGLEDESDYLNPGLSDFLRGMSEIITPEIEFTEVIQQLSDDADCKK